ncbi:MAG: hypothetical protein WCL50_13470 [Spirochaetota bacterium]
MKMLLFLPLSLALGVSTFAGAIQGAGAVRTSPSGDPLAALPGRTPTALEASAIRGGDVVMKLNANRTQLTVDVYSNDSELRRLNPRPTQSLTIDAHNRIVNTTSAPFMPANGRDRDLFPLGAGLTTMPAQFPAGTWAITGVRSRDDDYGPFMIGTNAVGRVDVYAGGVKVGSANDVGYAIHSNSKDFAVSLSYGCIIVRQNDNALIAGILNADRADSARENGRCVQFLSVGDRGDR